MLLRAALAFFIATRPLAMAEDAVPSDPTAEEGEDVDAVVAPKPPIHPTTGSWRLAIPKSELDKNIDAAVEGVASEFNMFIRELVRSKLEGATKVCKTYRLDVQDTVVEFACDGNKPVQLRRDGTPLHTSNQDGEPIRGTVAVQGDTLIVHWAGESGGRTNTFERKGDTLHLTATVSSSHMPKPLVWAVRYAP